MLIIPIKEGENIDRALKKYKKKYEKTNTVRFFHFHVPRTELLLLFVKYGLEKVSKADKIIMYKKTDFIF